MDVMASLFFMQQNCQTTVCHCPLHRVAKQPDETFLGHVISHNNSTDDARGVGFSVYPWAANGPLVSQSFWTKDDAKEYVQRMTAAKRKKKNETTETASPMGFIGVEPGD